MRLSKLVSGKKEEDEDEKSKWNSILWIKMKEGIGWRVAKNTINYTMLDEAP